MQPSRRSVISCAAALATLVLAPGCGSSTNTATAPSQITRCAISLNTNETTVPAGGGAGAVSVTATRECSWSASVEGGWLSIKSGANGQGEGTVEFAAASNPDPQTRTGAVVVNGTRAQVTQSAGECVIALAESSADFPPSGGTARIEVRASSPLCSWTSTSDSSWIDITSGASGRGSAPVTVSIAPTTGPPRAGALTIAGQRFSVTQSQGCTYSITATTHNAAATGAAGSVAVATAPACPWTAASNVEWITVNPSTGAGPGPVAFRVAPSQGPQRTGTTVIAGQLLTVTQSPGCAYQVEPTSHSIGAPGGTAAVSVSTAAGCSWTAGSNAGWITIQGVTAGSGSGAMTFSVAATTGAARSGTLTVAGQQVSVSQTQGCTFSISPQSQSVAPGGGTGNVTVTAGDGCAWTATSGAPWVTITSGSSGSGNGGVQFSVAATTGPARSATLTIAGQAFAITQGEGCTVRLSPSSIDIDDAGGQRSFEVQTGAGCGWTAATSTPWIAINAGASGSGNGTVRFTVAANTTPGRTGSITAGGQSFTVKQGTGCIYALSAQNHNVPAAGGSGSVNVTSGDGCAWTAASSAPWLTITSGANSSGNGPVGFTASANAGRARSGTLTIAGLTFTVQQGSGCTYSIAPTSQPVGAAGGGATVNVTADGSCAWTAVSNAPWIVVASGSAGTGSGTVQMSVEPNAGPPRTATVTAADQTFTITQEGGCAFTAAPAEIASPAGGGGARVEVTTSPSCAWTATSNDAWITVTAGATGTGNGPVDLSVAANTGPVRSGTVAVAGRTVTVSQGSGCTIAITPPNQTIPAAGGSGSVNVAAGAGCQWTAVSPVSWIVVTSGATGSGDGVVQFTVDVNATGTPRSATIAIGGQTFTVNQQ